MALLGPGGTLFDTNKPAPSVGVSFGNLGIGQSNFAKSFAASGGQAAIDADTRSITERFLSNVPSYISSGQSTLDLINLSNVQLPLLQKLPQINFANTQNLIAELKGILGTAGVGITSAETGEPTPEPPELTGTDIHGILNGVSGALQKFFNTTGVNPLLIGALILGVIILKK